MTMTRIEMMEVLTPQQFAIVEAVAACGDVIPVARLIDRIYADDPQGGPDDASRVIYTQVHRINARLPERWVRSVGRHGYLWTGPDVSSPPAASLQLRSPAIQEDLP